MALNEINADNEPLEEVRQVELEDIEEEPVSYLDRLAKYENMSLEPSYEWKTDDRQLLVVNLFHLYLVDKIVVK